MKLSRHESMEVADMATPLKLRMAWPTVPRLTVLATVLALAACNQAPPALAAQEPANVDQPAHPTRVPAVAAGPQSNAPDASTTIIEAIMARQYGSFDTKLACWAYSSDEGDYCMKPGPSNVVRSDGSDYLYFYAYSRPDIEDDPAYSYGHASPGLMGAFAVRIDSAAQWKLTASTKDLMFGSVGNCGCQDARFVRLGRDRYGWQFASGGVWQGVAVFNHNLVAVHDGQFVDMSAIPKVTEDEQDVEYGIQVDDSDKDAPAYPLLVTLSKADGKAKTIKVPFNEQKWQYTLSTEN